MSASVKGDSGLYFRLVLLLAAVGPVAGCGPPPIPYPAALQSERPDERLTAIKHAAEIRDYDAIGIIVDRLEDEDEDVRLYAILALEKLTGTRLGYNYYEPEAQRARAVKRWRRYLTERQPGGGWTSQPATGPTPEGVSP